MHVTCRDCQANGEPVTMPNSSVFKCPECGGILHQWEDGKGNP